MRATKEKAFAVSAAGHLLVVLIILVAGRSRPARSGYPAVITATLIERAPAKRRPEPVQKPKAQPVKPRPAPTQKSKPAGNARVTPRSTESTPPTRQESGDTSASKSPAVRNAVRIDAPEFPFPHYLALLQFRIEKEWQPPFNRSAHFQATVHFVIARNGAVSAVELETSSGDFSFDQAALRAVYNANPLPALPAGAGLETLGVHFDFVANW